MLFVGIAIGLIVGALLSRLFFARRGANTANIESVEFPKEILPSNTEIHDAELNAVLNAIPLGVVVTD